MASSPLNAPSLPLELPSRVLDVSTSHIILRPARLAVKWHQVHTTHISSPWAIPDQLTSLTTPHKIRNPAKQVTVGQPELRVRHSEFIPKN
jgi:hypothetical protein